MFHREGKDYSIQKFGKNLVMMCKVCKKKVLVSFEKQVPRMRLEEFEASHADEVKGKKHYTFVKEICQGVMTEVPLSRTEKECDVARILDINDTHHSRKVINETLIDVDVSDFVLALANCNEGIAYEVEESASGVSRVTMVLPSMHAIKYSPKLIGIDGTFHHHNRCTMVFSTIITQEKNVILAGSQLEQRRVYKSLSH